jgi:hypothetical protein
MDEGARIAVEDGRVSKAFALKLTPQGLGEQGWKA